MPDNSIVDGLDASRAYLINFSHHYWVSTDQLKAWLQPSSWDAWEAEQPAWFTDVGLDFQNRIMKHAPAEALPRTVLMKILSKAIRDGHTEHRELGDDLDTPTLIGMVEQHRIDTSAREKAARLARAAFAVKHWLIALLISYVDLVGDITVGWTLVETKSRRSEGYLSFGLTGFSLVAQAILAFALGQGPFAAVAGLAGAKPLLEYVFES